MHVFYDNRVREYAFANMVAASGNVTFYFRMLTEDKKWWTHLCTSQPIIMLWKASKKCYGPVRKRGGGSETPGRKKRCFFLKKRGHAECSEMEKYAKVFCDGLVRHLQGFFDAFPQIYYILLTFHSFLLSSSNCNFSASMSSILSGIYIFKNMNIL